ncbi:MAG: hypothetical protein KIC56_00370 [Clostridium sp.]|nr:hypothetical protein [Clostridium sp.]MEE0768388.1 hypothetical protein [Clostridia bacterium]
MVQDNEKRQNVTTYEIDNKKYTVITKCVENVQNSNKLYDVICKYAISQIESNLYICN